MRFNRGFAIALLVTSAILAALASVPVHAADGQTLLITGEDYTKWLWGTQRTDGSLYNFTSIPGEGYGDNGQGTEINFLLASKPSKYVEVTGRIQSRFSQNQWTNFGGFGGRNPAFEDPPGGPCVGGDCGEFDPRSNEYIKQRGLTVRITPGYRFVDAATIGSTDLGMFDAFTIGKVRYIDRDNAKAVLLQGAVAGRKLGYDLIRVSLPRLWAGPSFNTGDYTAADGAYGLQLRLNANQYFDAVGIVERVTDQELDVTDRDFDDGRDVDFRFKNNVYGVKIGVHPTSIIDVRGSAYFSEAESNPTFGTPTGFGTSGFSPVVAGKHDDEAYKANIDLNDPFGVGLNFNIEYFNIGEAYTSILAARREVDVLLTEGSDGAFAWPGPDNSSFGVFPGNPTRIGYGGWQGPAQQVATLNVDNEFTDFEESMAESVIGWKGITVAPTWTIGDLDLSAEYTMIDYNTNWQAWGQPDKPLDQSPFPNHESDAGVNSYRNAYAPFQDKETKIAVLRGKYLLDVGKGVEIFGKIKFIDEQDDRMTDPRFLPYNADGSVRFYSPGNSSSSIYFAPPTITVNGVTGPQWKPFNSLSDDDRDMDYKLYQLGAGYQVTDNVYGSITYEKYDVDLQDGNTAFQAYQLHNMASGQHDKNKLMLYARYVIGGAEFGANYEYNWGEFDPDFGGGFVTQFADADTAKNFGVPVGSPGFRGRFGGWNSLITRDFKQQRMKVFMKVRF
ncbi:MAG TPA: hypothetical protein VH394_01460 [Thermoanaerobaculia bacterium]|jgi:hypothetical protein|nr:hypothetical protein [Thermoanaerobaculia bacterium]